MFEKYTDPARRVIFFARYEANQFRSSAIETEHLLLGLIRDRDNLVKSLLGSLDPEDIRREIERRAKRVDKPSTPADLPFSYECKRILVYADEEAERMNHHCVTPGHLLLGILREKDCLAAEVLYSGGLALEQGRALVSVAPAEVRKDAGQDDDPQVMLPNLIDRIRAIVNTMGKAIGIKDKI